MSEWAVLRFVIPLRTVSESNRRDHWAVRAARVKTQRTMAHLAVRREVMGLQPMPERFAVYLTRHSPSVLDGDNLQGALKGVRDGIADALGIDDGDPRITWDYAQEKAKQHAVSIFISAGDTRDSSRGQEPVKSMNVPTRQGGRPRTKGVCCTRKDR
jgi:hypothetical protein